MHLAKKQQIEIVKQPEKCDQIFKMLLDGLPLWRLEFQVDQLIKNPKEKEQIMLGIRKRLEESANIDPLVVKGFCVSALQELYFRAVKDGDGQSAIKILREYNRVANTPINQAVELSQAEQIEDAD